MPAGPRLYRQSQAPTSPSRGDLRLNDTSNTVQVYNGLRWIDLTVPTNAGQPTTTFPDVANGSVYFDTTRRALTVFSSGSWFTMASMSLA